MPVRTSWFRFFGELKDHLPRELRNVEVRKDFLLPGSVKDVIESLGVPHTEVDAVTVNGESVDWSRLIVDGDRVSVYPVGYATGLQPVLHLMPEIAGEPRFVADVHLGRLAGYLRMLGFDTAYSNSATDPELVSIAVEEQRVLLTRDRELLKHGSLERGYWLRETAPRRQVEEVVRRFGLAERIRPLTRCIVCNGVLRSKSKPEVAAKVPPRVLEWCEDYRQCVWAGVLGGLPRGENAAVGEGTERLVAAAFWLSIRPPVLSGRHLSVHSTRSAEGVLSCALRPLSFLPS